MRLAPKYALNGSHWTWAELVDKGLVQRLLVRLGYLPQETSIFRGMTVEQNINCVLELVEPDPATRAAPELDGVGHPGALGVALGKVHHAVRHVAAEDERCIAVFEAFWVSSACCD